MEHWESVVAIIIQTLLFLAGGYGMVLRNDWSNKAMTGKVDQMQLELRKLSEVITIQAVQTTRIDNIVSQMTMLQRNVEDLRRGNGLIEKRRGMDGEYP